MLEHGGRLRAAATHYGIALDRWLDLSTGINPQPYPLPDIPAAAWHRLPEDDDGLEAAAAAYYGSDQLLAVAGSQPAIQALPVLVSGERVTVLAPTYAEHPHAWRARRLRAVDASAGDPARAADAIDAALDDTDVLLLVHPNNPTGLRFARNRLLDWHARLARRGGWLIIDEAFIDTDPAASLVGLSGTAGLIVLRSLGKFFGLAGARVGFVFAPTELRAQLADLLGPWAVSGPARHAARAALTDRAWQTMMRHTLATASARLTALLDATGLDARHGSALFRWCPHPAAASLHTALARQGVFVRLFAPPGDTPSLRFGLPADEAGWLRLEAALATVRPIVQSQPRAALTS